MKTWQAHAVILLALAVPAARSHGQTVPGAATPAPALPTAPATPAAASGTTPPAAGGLAGLCAALQQCVQKCKNKICGSPLGQLLGGMTSPLSAVTGGIITPVCSTPSQAALSAGGAEGAAAAIQQDEANAKKRRAAVRYLGTVDCHYWPEAEKNLIGALRTDTNECVRWEAAMALGSGCCCTRRTIEALTLTVAGSDKDGNPTETSERVREAARLSLQRCLGCYKEVAKAPERPEKPHETAPAPRPAAAELGPLRENTLRLTAGGSRPEVGAMAQTSGAAQRALVQTEPEPQAAGTFPTGKRSLLHIWAHAREPGSLGTEESLPSNRTPAPTTLNTSERSRPVAAEPPLEAAATRAQVGQLVHLLRTSPYVLQREWAVQNLARTEWWAYPEAVSALSVVASADSAETVRAACLRCLAQRTGNPPPLSRVEAGLPARRDVGSPLSVAPAALPPSGFANSSN